MTKKVLVIDSLTETFKGPVVKSGLQKSSKLDARAFHLMGYDTTFIYCGDLVDHYNYKKISVNNLGAKDNAAFDGKHKNATAGYIKNYLTRVVDKLIEADYIIVHCHSLGNMTGVNLLVKDKKIIFVVHDVIDMTWALGFSLSVNNMRKSARNYAQLVTNSQYSIDRLNYIYSRGKENQDRLLSGDKAFDSYIKHFVWTDQTPTIEEIVTKEKKSAVIGRYEPGKYHHKLYAYKNPQNTIVHYGIKDLRRDDNLKYYESLKLKANSYAEGLSDEDLWQAIKTSQSIIIPCYHEGFGYTAFEAGIFGVVPVVLTSYHGTAKIHDPNKIASHATTQYLERAGAKYFSAYFGDQDSINKAIDESLNVKDEDRIKISKKLLDYFTLEKYVKERVDLLENATKPKETGSLESFFV